MKALSKITLTICLLPSLWTSSIHAEAPITVICQAECWDPDLYEQGFRFIDIVRSWGDISSQESEEQLKERLASELKSKCSPPNLLAHSRVKSMTSRSTEKIYRYLPYQYESETSFKRKFEPAHADNSCQKAPTQVREIRGKRVGG